MEDLDTLKLFNGQRSMGTVGSQCSRSDTPRVTPMLGSPGVFWGYRCTDIESRNAAHVGELLVVYDHCKIMYKSIEVGDLLVTSVKQNAKRAPIAFTCDYRASAAESVRLW